MKFFPVPRFLLLLVPLLLVPLSPAADPDKLQQLYEEGCAKLDAGDHAGAIELFNTILEQEPKADNVLVNRAIAKAALKDLSGARADLAQAINLAGDNSEAYRVRAMLKYEAKDYTGSLADIDQAISLVPDDALLQAMRGEILRLQQRFDEAVRAFTRAIEFDASQAAYFFARGQCQEGKGDVPAAIADYSRTIQLDPKHADAHNNRGWIRFHRLEWASAIEDARKTLELAPAAGIAARLTGYAQFGAGNHTAAAEALTRGAELSKNDVEGYAFSLFLRHLAQQRSGAADRRLADGWAKWGDFPWFQALARYLLGEIDEEQLAAKAAEGRDDAERKGRECEMHFYIGQRRLQAGDRSTARLRFQAAVAVGMKTYIEHALAQAELKRL